MVAQFRVTPAVSFEDDDVLPRFLSFEPARPDQELQQIPRCQMLDVVIDRKPQRTVVIGDKCGIEATIRDDRQALRLAQIGTAPITWLTELGPERLGVPELRIRFQLQGLTENLWRLGQLLEARDVGTSRTLL